jgi:hypothetical protein
MQYEGHEQCEDPLILSRLCSHTGHVITFERELCSECSNVLQKLVDAAMCNIQGHNMPGALLIKYPNMYIISL